MPKTLFIFLFLFAAYLCPAQVNIITTIAGTGVSGYNGEGGKAKDALLNRPYALSVKDNYLFFADAFNHRIRKVDFSNGTTSLVAGNGNGGFSGDGSWATNAEFFVPQGICIDDDDMYISDGLNHRVRKVDLSTGMVSTTAGTGIAGDTGDGGPSTAAQLYTPVGLSVDDNGNIYIADHDNNKIRKIDKLTNVITTIAGTGLPGYTGDGGLAVNSTLNGTVDVICDRFDNIYISDHWNGAIRKVDRATGIITTVAGKGSLGYSGDGGPATNAELNEPGGLFLDEDDNLFIADYRNGAIRKVDGTTGIITTVAGREFGYGGDGGPATDAKLKGTDVCVDKHGNLYIADYPNDRIRKVNNAVSVNDISPSIESKLYPNPTTGLFIVQVLVGIAIVSVYNTAGQLVLQQTTTTTETEIDISFQPSGMYMVYVQCGDKRYVSKVEKR